MQTLSKQPNDAEAESHEEKHALTAQPGSRNAMAGAAERIGSVLGSAQRQVRHGLELVSPVVHHQGSAYGEGAETPAHDVEDAAARMMQAIEEGVAEIRHLSTGRLIPFQGPAAETEHRAGCRLGNALSELNQRARRFAAKNPVQTVAALLGLSVAFGAALRLHSAKRR